MVLYLFCEWWSTKARNTHSHTNEPSGDGVQINKGTENIQNFMWKKNTEAK